MSRRSKYDTNFGASVSVHLAEAKLSQAELADMLGKHPPHLNRVMTGTLPASPTWADMVADVLKLGAEQRVALHRAAALDSGYKLDLTKP